MDITRVAIVGAGMMGSGIAQVFAERGYRTILYDINSEQLDRALENIRSNLLILAEHGMVEREDVDTILGRIEITDNFDRIAAGDLVIECAPENMELKQELFEALDRICRPEVVLATNTSVMRVTEIASKARNRGRILGTHWWNPPYLLPLVEVVKAEETSEEAVQLVLDFLTRIGKKPVRVNKDVPGFIANRLQHALWREALALVQAGVADPETVDACIKYSFGRRLPVLGPFENMDMVGLDLTLAIHQYIFKFLDNSTRPFPVLEEKVRKEELGFKTGRGFREWTPEEADGARKRLLEHLLKAAKEEEAERV